MEDGEAACCADIRIAGKRSIAITTRRSRHFMGSSQIPLRFWIRPGWVASRVLRLSFASVNRVGNCQFRQFASKLVLGNEMARFDSGARFGEEVVVVGEGRGVAELAEEERPVRDDRGSG